MSRFQFGLSLVRSSSYRSPGFLQQQKTDTQTLPPDTPQTRFAMADELEPALQLALLAIRWTDLARACASKLRQEGVYVCGADRLQLRRCNLSIPTPGKYYDTLTPQGRWKADAIARVVAKKFNIHVLFHGGGFRTHTLRCSCGWLTEFTCSPVHKASTFAMWERRHLDNVEF